MSKPYRDMFGNPLTKNQVALAAQFAVTRPSVSSMSISRATGTGIGKASRIAQVLVHAGVIGQKKETGHVTILRSPDAAVNAALRQLKKGKK